MSAADETPTVRHVTPLAALIERAIDQAAALGERLQYADIARRGGLDLQRRDVQKWATNKPPIKLGIALEKRRALALGLGVHPVVVDRAVAETVGLWLELTDDDYRTDPDLTAQDRAQIDAYIKSIKDRRGRRHG